MKKGKLFKLLYITSNVSLTFDFFLQLVFNDFSSLITSYFLSWEYRGGKIDECLVSKDL